MKKILDGLAMALIVLLITLVLFRIIWGLTGYMIFKELSWLCFGGFGIGFFVFNKLNKEFGIYR